MFEWREDFAPLGEGVNSVDFGGGKRDVLLVIWVGIPELLGVCVVVAVRFEMKGLEKDPGGPGRVPADNREVRAVYGPVHLPVESALHCAFVCLRVVLNRTGKREIRGRVLDLRVPRQREALFVHRQSILGHYDLDHRRIRRCLRQESDRNGLFLCCHAPW